MLVDWTKLNKTRIKMIIILNRMSTLPLPYQFPEIVKFESSLTHQYQITACLSGTFSVNQISRHINIKQNGVTEVQQNVTKFMEGWPIYKITWPNIWLKSQKCISHQANRTKQDWHLLLILLHKLVLPHCCLCSLAEV